MDHFARIYDKSTAIIYFGKEHFSDNISHGALSVSIFGLTLQ